jgi:hypothetical protein
VHPERSPGTDPAGGRPKSPRARGSKLLGLLAVLLLAVTVPPAEPARAAPGELLPDLRMAYPKDMTLQHTSAGNRLLRVTAIILNYGAGPFEVRASRTSTSVTTMPVRQRIRLTDGTWTSRSTPAVAKYSGDGHNHWHVQRVASMELLSTTGQLVARGRKIGFCFWDTNRYKALPGSPSSRVYVGSGCGVKSSLKLRMGISVGWGDRYGAWIAHQWINVTKVPAGRYYVMNIADPFGHYREATATNNCSWALIRIPASGSTVTVLERGRGCTVPSAAPAPSPSPSPTPAPDPGETPSPSPSATPAP